MRIFKFQFPISVIIVVIQETFSLFDRDNDGAITSPDVIKIVRSLGHNPTEKEIEVLLREFDPDSKRHYTTRWRRDVMN